MNFSICNYWKRKSQQQNSNPKIFQHLQLLKLEREREQNACNTQELQYNQRKYSKRLNIIQVK